MLLSLKWLREFVPFEGSAQELADRLTMLGLEAEAILRPFNEIKDVVVGHVLTCEPHPDADKLRVCTVDVAGSETLNIVCGAPNIRAGLKVPVALVGTTLPGGIKISKAKLRGVTSLGMICSERELALSEDHGGIMELPDALAPGTKFVDAFDMDAEVCEIGITPNRGDCLSILGLAREVALGFNLPLQIPGLDAKENGPNISDAMRVKIESPADCPLYYGRVIEDVRISPSIPAVRYRLMAAGVRPVSNVVDVTNYIMLELGQPLHAFDMNALESGEIVVRRATTGLGFVTLDGEKRLLDDKDLLICDGSNPVALAGVMGGENSEIRSSTTKVFLESAVFNPNLIRRTARKLALSSEASYRFERGIDPNISLAALNRAAALIAKSTGGAVLPGICGLLATPFKQRTISFSPAKAAKVLGAPLTHEFCEKTLRNVGCSLDNLDEGPGLAGEPSKKDLSWFVYPPSHRNDITLEADLIEEVGRVYGLDRITPTLPKVARSLEYDTGFCEYSFLMDLRRWASGFGLNEVINYSFVGDKDLDLFHLPENERIHIKNPLSAEQNVLRTELAPGLLNTLRNNIAQGALGVRIFEIARSFKHSPEAETTSFEENRLGFLLYGVRHDSHWPQEEADIDYYDVKGIFEHLFAFFKLPAAEYVTISGHSWLKPAVMVKMNGESIGYIGKVEQGTASQYHARKPVWLGDINLELLMRLVNKRVVAFNELPSFPPVRRDITLICPKTLSVSEITTSISKIKMPLLTGFELIDLFVPEDKDTRNITFRFTFRHESRTLKDEEVDKEREKMAAFILKAMPVSI